MKKKSTNATVSYDPVALSKSATINFTKVVNANGTTVYGKIVKDDADAGNVSYDSKQDFLITSLKPYSRLTQDEVAAVYKNVPGCIKEILADE